MIESLFRTNGRFEARAWRRAAAGILLGAAMISGCVSTRSDLPETRVEPEIVQSSVRFRKEYVLAPGDQVEVSVRQIPDQRRTVAIRPDGYISLPMVDEVKAAGLTVPELDAKLTEMLSSRMLDPDVTVIATDTRQPMVYVLGDVNNNAGAVPLREAPTAAQAITVAGGLKRSAAARDIVIIRLTEEGYLQAIGIDPRGKGQPAPYLALRATPLQADDIIFIPESGRSQLARILDDFVNRPLVGLNALVGGYVNYRIIHEINNP